MKGRSAESQHNCFHLLVHSANAMLKATAWGTKSVTFLKDANIPGWLSTRPTGLYPAVCMRHRAREKEAGTAEKGQL